MKFNKKPKVVIIPALVVILALVTLLLYYVILSESAVGSLNKQLQPAQNCGSKTENGIAFQEFNECLESAFKQCTPAYVDINASKDVGYQTRYVVAGKDSKTGSCFGGYYYIHAPEGFKPGNGQYCKLDTDATNFWSAFSKSASGTPNTTDALCKQPADSRHL